jgi:crotonobetainyl-CoA:carnitine CoA-transferase CaiB-like acyl-CoA transferase
VLAWQATSLTAARRAGHTPERAAALLNGGAACYQIYRAADGRFVTLGALEEKFWANFCRAVRRDNWIERQWEPLPQVGLIAEVAALFARRTAGDWDVVLGAIDCCFQPILEPFEVPGHPQIRARGLVVGEDGPEPRVDVLFPTLVDGGPPAPRPEVRTVDAGELLAAWQAR